MMFLKINRLLPIYISIVPLKFEVDIQSQSKVRVRKRKKSNMAARWPFWKWHHWKWIGFCLWPPSTCIWNLKLKFQSKLDLCSGNHVVYRQTDGRTDRRTDGRTDKVNPVYPPPTSLGGGINIAFQSVSCIHAEWAILGDDVGAASRRLTFLYKAPVPHALQPVGDCLATIKQLQPMQPLCDQKLRFPVADQSATGRRQLSLKISDQSAIGRWLMGNWLPTDWK